MSNINAKITSKNQLTLPAKLVRKYGLDKNRSVIITDKNGALEIRPRPTLENKMQKHWNKFHKSHPHYKPLTDKDINDEARLAYGQYFKDRPPTP